MLCYFAHMYILWFYLNVGCHASDTLVHVMKSTWLTFIYSVRVIFMLLFYMTMSVVQLPNKGTSFIQSN